MTINVLLETILGKSCLLEGTFGDATPFTSNSTDIAEKLCNRLQENGYERHGWEELMNGFTGEPIKAKVFIGPTYYQRLKHMVGAKIHCLSMDTEVLTINGWKTYFQLTKDDLVAILKNNKLVYEKPIDIMYYPDHEGPMYKVCNNNIDLYVTGNHRMWTSVNNKPYNFHKAEDIVGLETLYKSNVDNFEQSDYIFTIPGCRIKYEKKMLVYENLQLDIEIMDSWLTLLGTYFRSGTCVYKTDSYYNDLTEEIESRVCYCKDTYLTNSYLANEKVEKALDELSRWFYRKKIRNNDFGFYSIDPNEYYKDKEKEYCEIVITDLFVNKYLSKLTSDDDGRKILPEWLFKLSRKQTKVFLDSFYYKDNQILAPHTHYSKEFLDGIQQLALHAGMSAVVIETNVDYGKRDTYEIRGNAPYDPLLKDEFGDVNGVVEGGEIVKCPVFCLQVSSEVFYVRRNGKPCWTANSRRQGDVTTLTRQPLEGRSRDGQYICITAIKQFKNFFQKQKIIINLLVQL